MCEDNFLDAYYESRTEYPNSDFYLLDEPDFIDENDEEYIEQQAYAEEMYERQMEARLDAQHDGDFDWRNGIGQE